MLGDGKVNELVDHLFLDLLEEEEAEAEVFDLAAQTEPFPPRARTGGGFSSSSSSSLESGGGGARPPGLKWRGRKL